MGLFDFLKKEDVQVASLPQNNAEIWIRDTYAAWSHVNCEDWEYIGGCLRDKEGKAVLRYILERDWGVESPKDCLDTVEGLKESVVLILEPEPEDDEDGDAQCYKEIIAWDLCRATQILAMGYVADYFDRKTFNIHSAEVGRLMQSVFSSWEDLMESYISGYADWANTVFGEDAKAEIAERKETYEFLKQLPNGPYKKAWLTNLASINE